jgi:hypothetical protein
MEGTTKRKNKSENKTDTTLREGEDYYLENGLFVFTAKHHLKRGHCCQSGCRHCPYGYKKSFL